MHAFRLKIPIFCFSVLNFFRRKFINLFTGHRQGTEEVDSDLRDMTISPDVMELESDEENTHNSKGQLHGFGHLFTRQVSLQA